MRTALTISAIFFLTAAKAQDLRSITVKASSVEAKYDSLATITGMQYDTIRTKTVVKFPGKQTSKTDYAYAETPITKTDTTTITKNFLNPVDIRFTITSAAAMKVTINGQSFNASKYSLSAGADPASTAFKDSTVNVPIPIYIPEKTGSITVDYNIKHQ